MNNKQPMGWNIVLRPTDGQPLLTSIEDRRAFARTMASLVERYSIFAFHAVIDHGHAGTGCPRDRVGRLERDAKTALPRALGRKISFLPIEPRPILDARHLLNDLHYILGQSLRHSNPDLLHDASNFPDLMGYRVIARATREVLVRLLPSFRSRDLLRHMGGLELVLGTELRYLADSAAAAIGRMRLEGNGPLIVRARVAAVSAGLSMGATCRQIADGLELSSRAVRRCAARPADEVLVRAIRIQVGLREQVGTRAMRFLPVSDPTRVA